MLTWESSVIGGISVKWCETLQHERNFAELAGGRMFCMASSDSALRCTRFSSFERYPRELAKWNQVSIVVPTQVSYPAVTQNLSDSSEWRL